MLADTAKTFDVKIQLENTFDFAHLQQPGNTAWPFTTVQDIIALADALGDGHEYTVPAGTQIRLTPGKSIHIYQRQYHDFSVEPGTGAVLLGEVSQCNDDNTDNRFNPPAGRFPKIEEDEPPYRLLCSEYPAAK